MIVSLHFRTFSRDFWQETLKGITEGQSGTGAVTDSQSRLVEATCAQWAQTFPVICAVSVVGPAAD